MRPTDAPELSLYEIGLTPYVSGYPDKRKLTDEKRVLHETAGLVPVNFFNRLFRGGVSVSDSRHPKYSQWVALDKKYSAAVEKFSREVISYRIQAYKEEAEKSQNSGYWRNLSGREFEEALAGLLRRKGIVVHHVGGSGDEGADLIIQKDGAKVLIQCKAFSKPVGPGPVRDLYGALLHHKADSAWLVSLEGFTPGAIKFAAGKPIELLPINIFLNG